jgi:hypothetical protein
MSKNDKTAIIDSSVLEDFTPDNWEDQPSNSTPAIQEEVLTPKTGQQQITKQKFEILRNEDKANEIRPSNLKEEKKEHLSVEDRLRRYNEARARIFLDQVITGLTPCQVTNYLQVLVAFFVHVLQCRDQGSNFPSHSIHSR